MGPVSLLTRGHKHRWLRSPWVFVVSFLLVLAVFQFAQLPTTPTTPSGVELELPGTADGALAVLRAFDDADALDRARLAIYWDFVLILGYSIGLATLLEWLGATDPKHADALIGYAAWGALLAGLLDIFEDTAMLLLLAQYPHASANFALTALLGTLASLAKWTVLCAVVGYSSWEIAKRIGRSFQAPKPDARVRSPVWPMPGTGGEGTVNDGGAKAGPPNPYAEPVFDPQPDRGKQPEPQTGDVF